MGLWHIDADTKCKLPRVPLGEFYGQSISSNWLTDHKSNCDLQTSVKQLIGDAAGIRELESDGGERVSRVMLSSSPLPWRRIGELIPKPRFEPLCRS